MTATTTKSLSPTQSKIKDVKREISSAKTKIEEQDKAILEFQEAIQLIESDAKYTPQPKELEPFDRLQQLLAEEKSKAEKYHKLTTARQALEDCKTSLQSDIADLANYNNYLLYLQSENEWETKFAPHAERFRSSFPLRTALQQRQQQIDELTRDIAYKKDVLKQAEQWLKAPREAKPRYFIAPPLDNASTAQSYLPKAIHILEAKLKELQATPIVECPNYQKGFREYVRARILLEEPLKEFLKVQLAYRDAVDALRVVLVQQPPGIINLNLEDLEPRKKLTLDEDNCIRYA